MIGGKMVLEKRQSVRILTIDGNISSEEYHVEIEKPDRKGYITLSQIGTSRKVKVNQRRVLINCNNGEAFVVESGDRYRAVCPNCTHFEEVTGNDDKMTCPRHGEIQLHWKEGERPMTDVTTAEKKEKTAKKEKQPTAAKREKAVREPIVVDFDSLKKNTNFEIWTKKSVQFDHERIDVQAHVLLIAGDSPRKFCFNTYNGTLGKKGKPLPIDEFVKDSEVEGEKKPWYAVPDIEKARARLSKDGYEQQ